MTTMNTKINYTPKETEIENIKADITALLNVYFPNHLHKGNGLDKMFNENGIFWKQKGWLINAMKNHPFYNGNYQIVIPCISFSRGINTNIVKEFKVFLSYN